MKERGFQTSSLKVTIFQFYFPSFESKSIDSVSYRLMVVLTFHAVANALGAAARLATAVAMSVVMADVRAVTMESRAADGTTASPPVFSSSSAFPCPPRAILPSMVKRQLFKAVGLINCCNDVPKHGYRVATRS